jgi:hypothetical protein
MFGFVLCSLLFLAAPKKAEACCSCTATATTASQTGWYTDTVTGGTVPRIQNFLQSEFTEHQNWYITTFWEDNLLPAMQLMSEQLTSVAMQQVQIIGTFLDAKHQMETQQVFEKVRARAHKDYHPSHKYGLCEIGSSAKSLAASERKAEFNAMVMSQRSQDRAVGSAYTAAAAGEGADRDSRIRQFRTKFCDPMDNNKGLNWMCDHDQDGPGNTIGATNPERMNKDIDFIRTVDWPWTINADFTDTVVTDEEEEILALASNLYGHEIFKRPPSAALSSDSGESVTAMQNLYLDARSVLAKQSVAENSFNAITSMKMEGLPGSREYLLALLEHLGIPNDPDKTTPRGSPTEAEILLGADPQNPNKKINPSYYAQMEILTKKIYENPDFFTHLYDTPANIARKQVAMQAIGLMQKFDLFKSYLRSEASLSVLLELAVVDLQNEIEDTINEQALGGAKDKKP